MTRLASSFSNLTLDNSGMNDLGIFSGGMQGNDASMSSLTAAAAVSAARSSLGMMDQGWGLNTGARKSMHGVGEFLNSKGFPLRPVSRTLLDFMVYQISCCDEVFPWFQSEPECAFYMKNGRFVRRALFHHY